MTGIAEQAIAAGAIQKPAELAALLRAVADVDPKVIVEIGSDRGGTLLGWQLACPQAAVISVNLQSGPFSTGAPLDPHGASVVEGDSHDQATLTALKSVLRGRAVDVLFIDGDHTYEGVLADFEMYMPLVRPGGLVCFHDICHHPNMPQVGVDRLWGELSGALRAYVSQPDNWGGIGVLEV